MEDQIGKGLVLDMIKTKPINMSVPKLKVYCKNHCTTLHTRGCKQNTNNALMFTGKRAPLTKPHWNHDWLEVWMMFDCVLCCPLMFKVIMKGPV